MLRVSLVKLAEAEHVMLFNMHHIASDGWSMGLLVSDLRALYEACRTGQESPLPPLRVQYADYAQWQRQWLQGEVLEDQLSYWHGQLEGLPRVHNLPLDAPRPARQGFEGGQHVQRLGRELKAQAAARCRESAVTLFMFLEAAFAVLLSRYSQEMDVVVGSPIAGRVHRDVEPLIGLFVMLAWGLNDVIARSRWRAVGLGIVAAVLLVPCAFLSARQARHWRNSETLFRQATRVTRNNYLAYNNLGFYLSGKGKVAEAMENYRKSLEINPAYEDAQNNLGYALAGQKKYSEAIAHYNIALKVRPEHVEVHNNLGNALWELGRTEEAIQHYRFVLQRNPEHADANNNLGIALAMQGKLDEAITHFQAALRVKPNYASAHSNLGNAMAAQHKLDEAIREYKESLRLSPGDAQAHNNLANALAEQGKLDESVEHYGKSLELNPENPETHFNLGIALVRKGKRPEAAAQFTEALRLKPDYAEARKQLDSLVPASGP